MDGSTYFALRDVFAYPFAFVLFMNYDYYVGLTVALAACFPCLRPLFVCFVRLSISLPTVF